MSANIIKWLDQLAVGGIAGFSRNSKNGASGAEPAELAENLAFSFYDMLRLVLGGTFVFAGVLKLLDPAAFAPYAGHYQSGWAPLVNSVIIILPWLALTAGLLVLAGIWLRAAAIVMASLAGLLLVAGVVMLVHSLDTAGHSFGMVGGRHIELVNLVIATTVLALALLLASRSKGPDTVVG